MKIGNDGKKLVAGLVAGGGSVWALTNFLKVTQVADPMIAGAVGGVVAVLVATKLIK